MRVIAGIARSLPLKTPAGMETRPTSDRIKETLFNMLQAYIPDCVFADLFSGSGGIGIEALSRGAQKCYFVDSSPAAAACIAENLMFTRLADKGVLLKQDVLGALYNIYEKHVDVIFMDPPYGQDLERQALELLKGMKYVSPDTLIVVEAQEDTDFSYLDEMGYELIKEKNYKTNKHVFITLKEEQT